MTIRSGISKAIVIVYATTTSHVMATFQHTSQRRHSPNPRFSPALIVNRNQHRVFDVLASKNLGNQVPLEQEQPQSTLVGLQNTFSRREASMKLAQISAACLGCPTLVFGSHSNVANAVVMSNDSAEATVFKAGEALGPTKAKARFVQAKASLQYLLDHYDEIVAQGGGDNVRRYLGTVGVSSALYGIPKVLKELQDEAKDVVEYTENMYDFDFSLRAADTAVYSANFVEFSAAKTKPEKFFEDARLEAERMMVFMEIMAAELDL